MKLLQILIVFSTLILTNNSAFATNPISREALGQLILHQQNNNTVTSTSRNWKSSTLDSRSDKKSISNKALDKVRKWSTMKVEDIKSSSKVAIICSSLSILTLLLVLLPISFYIFWYLSSIILAIAGIVLGLVVLLKLKQGNIIEPSDRKKIRRRAWLSIILPIATVIVQYVLIFFYWSL